MHFQTHYQKCVMALKHCNPNLIIINNNNNLDLSTKLVLKAHYIITPARQTHKSFLNPSQLPDEYTAQLLPFRRI